MPIDAGDYTCIMERRRGWMLAEHPAGCGGGGEGGRR